MDQKQAETLASILGGEAWHSGGGIWLVTIPKDDGRLVVFSGDCICEYASEEAFHSSSGPAAEVPRTRAGKASGSAPNLPRLCEAEEAPALLARIDLPAVEDRWVIQDDEGNIFYENDDLELGWTDEYEAERQARYLETREGGRLWVREQ
jgi:hypothetical protein